MVTAAAHSAVDVMVETFLRLYREGQHGLEEPEIVRYISPDSPYEISRGIPERYVYSNNEVFALNNFG